MTGSKADFNFWGSGYVDFELFGQQLYSGSITDPTFLLGDLFITDGNPGGSFYTLTVTPLADTPEPFSIFLVGSGALSFCGLRRRGPRR